MLKYYISFDFFPSGFCWSLFLHNFYDTLYEKGKFGLRYQYIPINEYKVLADFAWKRIWIQEDLAHDQKILKKRRQFPECLR